MNRRSIYFTKLIILAFIQLICFASFSQNAGLAVADKLKSYSAKAIQEKLFLHTDKEFYVAGEIVWFKIYYVEGITHQPMNMSKIAYTEILNSNSEPVLQAKISLEEGAGKGSFYLPPSLSTGNYTLRAYTNWMKNFDATYFYEKKITIVNTLKAPEAGISADSATVDINFFPEGGNLVSELESRIGFTVNDNNGAINDCAGYILTTNNDTVISFRPLKFGIGSFVFTPHAGNVYRAFVALPDGRTISKALPEIYESGYVMNVKDNEQRVRITIKRKAGAQNADELLLIAHKRQVLHIAQKVYLNNEDSVVFFIDKDRLEKGVTYFTLFDRNEKPVCERLFFIKPGATTALTIESDHPSYGSREKISLSLKATASPAPFHVSASVFYIDSLQSGSQATIGDYMWLTSELTGNVESPAYYFSNDPGVPAATDNLMLTHGWRRFRWNDIPDGANSFIKYLPEINGQVITGRIKDPRNDQPVSDANAYLSVQAYPFGFYTAKSDKNGFVYFEVKDFYGNSQVLAQPGIDDDSLYRVEIFKPFAETPPGKKYSHYLAPAAMKDQLLQKSIGMQVQSIYAGDSLRNFQRPELNDTLPFFGAPEVSYHLDDYKRFTTMEEVLREYVREIGVGARNERLIFKIFDPVAHDFYSGSSLVLLDGVPLRNPNKIFFYDPLKVRKLDVIRARYVIGKSTFNGVASFVTYNGAFDAYELDPKLVAIDYSGLQLKREFYSPSYETGEQKQKRIPDFRNTLYWAPDITTGKDGVAALQFYSSDLRGKYLVMIQGMNENGEFVAGTTSIEVR